MVTKQVFDTALRQLKTGAITVTYWDGTTVTYGPGKPYNHITVKTAAAGRAILKNMSLGFNEGYMDGTINVTGDLRNIVRLLAENRSVFIKLGAAQLLRPNSRNSRHRQAHQIQHHYDLGNDFYKLWLDRSMTYSCAYFHKPRDSLDTAQRQKVEYILRKLQLSPGQSLLDIGSGWGNLLITAAKQYGIQGLGITLSKEQLRHSQVAAKRAGVADKVRFELTNYQDLATSSQEFDRIVSVGMFEHVGKGNHKAYYKAVQQLLKPQGLSVLHTITQEREHKVDPWIDKYIFPGGYLPSVREIVRAMPRYDFKLMDYENLRMHYAMTLDHWLERFERNRKQVVAMYDERFYRMWRLYLSHCSSDFRYWNISLSQYVFTKGLNNDLPLTRKHLYH